MIAFHNVSKSYKTRGGFNHVLRGADMMIGAGEKVGILGRNGAGKSTTIRLLSGAELPSSGRIERTMSVSWPLAFGGAFQAALTGRDNAKCIARIYGRPVEPVLEYVADFAELGVYFNEPVSTYSSGMAARLAFAISMSIEFDCFLIDEIVHVGDHRFHEKCQIELFEKRKDRAMVIVSHSEGFVREHCDRAYVLKNGKLLDFRYVDDAIDFHTNSLHLTGDDMAEHSGAGAHDSGNQYVLGPDSLPREGVPQGRIEPLVIPPSPIFPGCRHDAWLYLPAGYDGEAELPLMVFQDGWVFMSGDGPWQVPTVMDNLIADGSLPPMVVLFAESGKPERGGGLADEQRSLEYDSVNDAFACFVIEALLPATRFHARIADDPRLRGIGGWSSGGFAAFNAAWQRPDAFSRVLSFCGSFVDIRGGGAMPELVRSGDARPLRVFLQDSAHARLGGKYAGLDWPAGNRAMARALAAKGNDFQLVMGESDHSYHHGAAILPDALRWLWR